MFKPRKFTIVRKKCSDCVTLTQSIFSASAQIRQWHEQNHALICFPSMYDRAIISILWIAQQTEFSGNVFLSPCSDFHYRIMSVFNAELYEHPKIPGIQKLIFSCALCTQRFLQILWIFWWYYIPYCRWWDRWFRVFINFIVNFFTMFMCSFLQVGEPLSILTSLRLCLSKMIS